MIAKTSNNGMQRTSLLAAADAERSAAQDDSLSLV
jgi:hypothetical protein